MTVGCAISDSQYFNSLIVQFRPQQTAFKICSQDLQLQELSIYNERNSRFENIEPFDEKNMNIGC